MNPAWSAVAPYGTLTNRNPFTLLYDGAALHRYGARAKKEFMSNAPPRNTRLVPDAGPVGSVTALLEYGANQSFTHSHTGRSLAG